MQHSRSGRNAVSLTKKGTSRFMGELEAQVMEIAWEFGRVCTRAVNALLQQKGRKLAYTTVLTVLENLRKKELLSVEKEGKTNFYSPLIERDAYVARQVDRALDALFSDFPRAVIASLAEKGVPEEHLSALLKRIEETEE